MQCTPLPHTGPFCTHHMFCTPRTPRTPLHHHLLQQRQSTHAPLSTRSFMPLLHTCPHCSTPHTTGRVQHSPFIHAFTHALHTHLLHTTFFIHGFAFYIFWHTLSVTFCHTTHARITHAHTHGTHTHTHTHTHYCGAPPPRNPSLQYLYYAAGMSPSSDVTGGTAEKLATLFTCTHITVHYGWPLCRLDTVACASSDILGLDGKGMQRADEWHCGFGCRLLRHRRT